MTDEIERFVGQVHAFYKDIIVGDASRITRGQALWGKFEAAAGVCRADKDAGSRQLTECVNELAVAKALIEDQYVAGPICYEPGILPDDRKIDFVVTLGGERAYFEVKTVQPQTEDTEKTWRSHLRRREYYPKNVHLHVEKEWLGGMLAGKRFTARSRFMEYTLEFESRLAAAKNSKPGLGILVFCGNGFDWHYDELEDFVDFYRIGAHRQDDPFALMEKHDIEERGLQLLRNIDHFAYLERVVTQVERKQLIFPVRGPRIGAPRVEA
ncbi:MAG: hypothetical protein IH996_09980 [Proteobacteria bacterium]|nr:hypothetical protein [Pseudomonadota bacterium]